MYEWKLAFISPFHISYKVCHLETLILLVWIIFDFTENIAVHLSKSSTERVKSYLSQI
jgi:hypothetical protein